jgi:hypothetical protein
MASLLHDIRRGASPKAEAGQQTMQVGRRRDARPRRAEAQPRAGGRIEHPAGHDGDDARSRFDVDDLAARPALAVPPSQAEAVQRMPAIVDDHFSPDMGRMSA